MSTLTLSLMRTLIRGTLNESSTSILSDAELNSLVNDGYKDVAVKGLCYENKITKTDISISQPIISLRSDNVIKVNYVEYDLSSSGLGMASVYPQTMGHIGINGYTPQFWFQWGSYLVLEPLPDVGTYDLFVYEAIELFLNGTIVRQCKNCGKYFIQKTAKEELYCDNIFEAEKTCKQIGYEKTMSEFDRLYRTAYKTKHAWVKNHPNYVRWSQKAFDKWIEQAKLLKGKLERNETNIEVFNDYLKKPLSTIHKESNNNLEV